MSGYPAQFGRGSDPRDLVQPPLPSYIGDWESLLGERRAFRVRGIPWFRRNVRGDLRELTSLIPRMVREARERPNWTSSFGGVHRFSIKQLVDAGKYEPLLFEKAALSILILDIASRETNISQSDVYDHLHIEPAVYRIEGFDRGTLNQARSKRPDILEILRRDTQQNRNDVFYDLANNKTVSYRLADAVRSTLEREVPGSHLGSVVVGVERAYRLASTAEIDPNEPWPNKITGP